MMKLLCSRVTDVVLPNTVQYGIGRGVLAKAIAENRQSSNGYPVYFEKLATNTPRRSARLIISLSDLEMKSSH